MYILTLLSRHNLRTLFISSMLLFCSVAHAQDTLTYKTDELFDLSLEELLQISVTELDRKLKLYGYINTNAEQQFDFPSIGADGITVKENDPFEWVPVKAFHVYGSAYLSENIDVLFNLAYVDETIEVRNAWGNFKIARELQIRVGKMYRRFGLYNEKLDQIPTFTGIEPPEIFDADHLFLTRTTNFMLHGNRIFGSTNVQYSLTTENGEGGAAQGVVPLGWDLRMKSDRNSLVFGTSGFTSSMNGKNTTSTVAFNDGPPKGGVLPWMDGDHFVLAGLFGEKQIGKVNLQVEYWIARHDARRNPDNVLTLVREAGINPQQRQRFLGANSNKTDDQLTTADVVVPVSYDVKTYYIRLAYNIDTRHGQFVPYLFLDWMSHPEAINNKDYGGDKESGLADDGIFTKTSAGVVYRPLPTVAIKLDGSIHSQKFNGQTVQYPEIRLDLSWAFKN
ncbi:hypothetical protein [Dawidia soli]|uniref:Uncharacterized protein n=1 Tax=Dawidia soli TaxID=2782352 RepID=A0AAP2GLS3_9BACT|nr:hypothetical protein [Dawidia soli]MBT1690458.1 hypothetical protein [Dawidia soli]